MDRKSRTSTGLAPTTSWLAQRASSLPFRTPSSCGSRIGCRAGGWSLADRRAYELAGVRWSIVLRTPQLSRFPLGGRTWSGFAQLARSSQMIVPRRPDANNPGPRGPDAFSPTGGGCRRAALAGADIRPSCQRISSLTVSGRSGAASPAALAAYTAAPRVCAPPCEGCSRPARPLGRRPPLRELTSRAAACARRNGAGPPRRQAREGS
jgi:hypothetical protein